MRWCALLLAAAGLCFPENTRNFVGVIHDNRCVGPNCATQCPITKGPTYTLQSGDEAWVLSDQKTPAQYTGLLYEHGGFVDDILVHKVSGDEFFLCVNASNQEKDFAHIQAANTFDCAVDFVSPMYAQLALQGPKAIRIAQMLSDITLSG